MPKVSTTLSLDADIKPRAQALFADLGLDLSTAVNMFLRQSVYVHGLPFAPRRDIPNEVTRAALAEGDAMLASADTKRFSSVDDLFADLEAE